MPTGVITSYIPWILYFLIAGNSTISFELAAIVAFVAEIIFGFRFLVKKFILDWCALIYFGLLSILFFTPLRSFLDQHAYLLSNIVLALIMWGSIIFRRPFTAQYAKEDVPQIYWHSPRFIKVNYYISTVWAIALTVMAIATYLQSYTGAISNITAAIIQIISAVIAFRFTQRFPDWYRGYLFRKLSVNREDLTKNPFLQGNFTPLRAELEQNNLEVVGKIPHELAGVYLRNGPNPAVDPISYTYPLDGDGMIHAIYLKDGKARYRNQYVETKGYLAEKRAGHALYGGIARPLPVDPKLIGKDGDLGPIKNGAFIHVLAHANQIMAMSEADPAYEITRDLKTLGEWVPVNAEIPFPVNAHTRLDPNTKDLFAFTYALEPPYLKYYVINKFGQLTKTKSINKDDASMMHDFILTKNYLIFFDAPAVFNMKGLTTNENVLQWQPERKMRIILIHRKTDKITIIEDSAFFVFHFANGYEKDDHIYIDYVRHQQLSFTKNTDSSEPPKLYRATINLIDQTIQHEKLLNYLVEFPRINEDFVGQAYRYIYLLAKNSPGAEFNRLIKYDKQTKTCVEHDFLGLAEISEAIFIPKKESEIEDEGYVVLFAYLPKENRSDFLIFDAKHIQADPIATVKLSSRVPHGLHGTWVAE